MTRRNDIKPSNVFISWTSKDKHIEQKILAHLDKNAITVCESGKGCAGDYKQWSNDAAIAPDIFMLILTKNLVCYPTSLARDEMKAWKNMLKETGDSSNRTVIVCPSLDIIKEFKDESGDLIISEEDHINCEVYSEEDGLTEENLENILNKIRNLLVHRMSDIYAKKSVEDIGINIPRLLGVDLIYLENNKAEYDDLYIPRTVKLRNGQFNNSEELISQSDTDLLFITADAGVGKSCYIKQIFKENNGNDAFVLSVGCAEAANNILNNRNFSQYPSLAVFLYKRFIRTCGFENSFYTLENFITLLKNKVAEEKRVIVVLDALDEIANFTRINEFIREVENLREFFNGKIKIVITDRSDVNARKFTNVDIAKLEQFDDADVFKYCNKLFTWINFSRITKNVNNIDSKDLDYRVKYLKEDIRQNPLMLTQIVLLYVLTGEIKDNEIGIFDDMTEILFKRENLKAFLGLNRNIPNKIVELLTVFAYNRQICVSQGKKWTRQKAIKLFDDILLGFNTDAGNLQCVGISGEELVDYLVYRSFFDFERDKFCHLRYGEYLVARYFCDKVFDEDGGITNQKKLDELLSHCGDEHWKNIIQMFVRKSGIKELSIPYGVNYIINSIFEQCDSLIKLTISSSVKEIGDSAFRNCCNLQKVIIGEGVEIIGEWAFSLCRSLNIVDIGRKVKLIGRFAFYYCTSIVNIDIPDNTVEIAENSFGYCTSLCNVKLGVGLVKIGKEAFNQCISLLSINIPDNISIIEKAAFSQCESLYNVKIGNDVEIIEENLFSYCNKLKDVQIGKGVKSIGKKAFYKCTSLEKIVIPKRVEKLENLSFGGCLLLKSLKIGKAVEKICYDTFEDCHIEELTIEDDVEIINDYAFANYNYLQTVVIGKGVKKIGEGAFSGCRSIRKVVISKDVKNIDKYCFEECTSLNKIYFEDTCAWTVLYFEFRSCINSTDLEDPEKAAKLLTDKYSDCDWVRE